MNPALTARAVAEILTCHPDTVYRFARQNKIPGPIDPTLPARMWRWSPQAIEQYVNGEWAAA